MAEILVEKFEGGQWTEVKPEDFPEPIRQAVTMAHTGEMEVAGVKYRLSVK